jgi:hypothetical protein
MITRRLMSDDRADLILNMLRAIRAKLDEHDRKFDEVIIRLGRVERELANLHVDFAVRSDSRRNLRWAIRQSSPVNH